MTRIQIELPDATAQAAREAGLLSSTAIQELLEDAMRRQAGRRAALARLLAVAPAIEAAGAPPITEEEIAAEVEAARAERKAASRGAR
ncbi:MAG TPA: hypothetical protein VK630_18260 [Reyranella sp.]|nr:hypothetical protein [Reyranella sp.]